MSISENTFISVSPKKDTAIADILNELEEEENLFKCYRKSLDLLSRRQHGEAELRTKLSQKGFSKNCIDSAIEKVKQMGYLNDEMFVESYISDKQKLQRWGIKKITYELQKKGLKFLADYYDNDLEKENAIYHAKKKCGNLKSLDFKKINKLRKNLISKGFEFDSVNYALKHLDQHVDFTE